MENNTVVRSDKKTKQILPVLFCFFIMGFVDIVGTATANIKQDLNLSNTLAGLLPNFIFIWFIICSIPIGLMMNRIGRKKTVIISNILTLAGMLVPVPMIFGLIEINLTIYLLTFVLLGIGNTMLQVSLNPLLTNIVSGDKLTSSITMGQFVKALSSLLGPQIVLFATLYLKDWNYVFIIYACVIALSTLWLLSTSIPREKSVAANVTFRDTLFFLKDRFIFSLFICILLIVGIDVGLNFFIPIIFRDIYGMEHATNMNTLYFAARALGSFLCAFMLMRITAKKILYWTMILSIAGYIIMMILINVPTNELWSKVLFCLMFIPVGFATANVFSIIFSFALQYKPENADQISSLLIMGVAGGGAITLIMGILTDLFGILGGMAVLLFCMLYILSVSVYIRKKVS